jgi:hypothetical protein
VVVDRVTTPGDLYLGVVVVVQPDRDLRPGGDLLSHDVLSFPPQVSLVHQVPASSF